MRRTLALAVALGLLLSNGTVAAQGETESAEVPSLEKLDGKYQYIGDQTKDTAMIQAQINAAVATMSSLIRNAARKKLEGSNDLVKSIEISTKGDVVTVALDDWVVDAPTNGSKRTVTTPAGESAQAWFEVASASLIQEIEQKTGTRKNTFHFTDSDTLVMTVQETSSRLSTPVEYDLRYSTVKK